MASPVFADDAVITLEDASVSIRLLHNLALWRLDGGQRKRVDQTAAWRASKEAVPQALAQRAQAVATASAGRHSEREAAASAESAVRTPAPVPAVGQPASVQAEPRPAEQVAQKPTSRVESAGRPSRKSSGAASSNRRAALGGAGDDLELGLGKQGALGPGSGSSGGGSSSGGQSGDGLSRGGGHESKEVVGLDAPRSAAKGSGATAKDQVAPSVQVAAVVVTCNDSQLKAAITAGVHRLKSAFVHCQSAALKGNPELAAQLRAEVTVDAEGRVTEVSVTPPDQPASACVQGRLKSMGGLPARAAPETVQIVLKFALR